mmetsp:Transcript_4285/g.12551  ORF Transcript_4285/g.12551 Transcript_4285/m.12551 type:complete len:328 (-) Transcript_4285:633-1616(-)
MEGRDAEICVGLPRQSACNRLEVVAGHLVRAAVQRGGGAREGGPERAKRRGRPPGRAGGGPDEGQLAEDPRGRQGSPVLRPPQALEEEPGAATQADVSREVHRGRAPLPQERGPGSEDEDGVGEAGQEGERGRNTKAGEGVFPRKRQRGEEAPSPVWGVADRSNRPRGGRDTQKLLRQRPGTPDGQAASAWSESPRGPALHLPSLEEGRQDRGLCRGGGWVRPVLRGSKEAQAGGRGCAGAGPGRRGGLVPGLAVRESGSCQEEKIVEWGKDVEEVAPHAHQEEGAAGGLRSAKAWGHSSCDSVDIEGRRRRRRGGCQGRDRGTLIM